MLGLEIGSMYRAGSKRMQDANHIWKVSSSGARGWRQAQSTATVQLQLGTQIAQRVKHNRPAVSTLGRIAVLCAGQDIGLRGHREDQQACVENQNRGNFLEILDLIKLESNEIRNTFDIVCH